MKQTLITALLLAGANLFAGTPMLVKNDAGNEFFKKKPQLSFEKKSTKKHLKLNRAIFSGSSREWDESEMTSSGLFLNIGLMLPSSKYLNPYGITPNFKLGYDFELGNFFRFAKISQLGIGLRATWLSLDYSSFKDEETYHSAYGSILRVGPQVSIALSEVMAVDVFYQFGYSYSLTWFTFADKDYNSSFLGFSHEIGAAFRFKVFSLGVGYRLGKLTNVDNSLGSDFVDKDKKYAVNGLRILLGFKF